MKWITHISGMSRSIALRVETRCSSLLSLLVMGIATMSPSRWVVVVLVDFGRLAPPLTPVRHGIQSLWEIHATSKSPAAPIPPPTHIVTTTYRAPRRLPSMSA